MAKVTDMEVDDTLASSVGGAVILDPLDKDGSRNGLKCIMGCKIEESKKVIPLTCLHFVCSRNCAVKLKAESTSGSLLRCNLCNYVVRPEQLEESIIPSNLFIKKKDLSDVELICENCVWNRPATAYCPECPACLCKQCKELHPQTRATQKHVIEDNISAQKAKQLENLKEAETNCKDHSQKFTEYCEKCGCKICQKCLPAHEGHLTLNIENERNRLKSTVSIARELADKFDRAVDEIKNKHTEILTTEWNNISANIHEQFEIMAKVLAKRQNELKMEARARFMRQLAALNMRSRCAEYSKASSEQFISVAEDILNNRADIAAIKFARQYREYMEGLSEMNEKFTLEYSRFVDKDWHFKLDLSAEAQAQKYLSEYCQVEYSYSPSDQGSQKQTHSSGNAESASFACIAPVMSIAGNRNSTSEPVRNPSRRIAVKSTAAAQLSANKLKGLRTYSRKNSSNTDQVIVTRTSGRISALKKQVGVEDAETEPEEEAEPTDQTGLKSSNLPEKQKNAQNDDEIVDVDTVDDREDASTIVVENGNDEEFQRGAREVSSDQQQPPSRKRRRKEKSQDTSKSRAELEGMPVLTASSASLSTMEGTNSKSIVEQPISTPNKSRPGGASPESCISSVSDSSELGVGKRERKKKSFPEFVDTEESLRFLGQPEDALAAAKMRRKSTPAKLPKIPRLLQQPLQDPEVKLEVSEEADSENVEVENGLGYESSDGCGSETGPSLRRQSLRRRATQLPDTPESSTSRKPRTEATIDDSTFKEAPVESIEIAAEMIDFPVQGQGRMKISNVDENEDYCSICLDGGEDIIVCCDFCPKVFHLKCHIPVIKEIPEGDAKWRCNYDTTKETIDERVASCPDSEGSEKLVLNEANERHFVLACKFVMECYKIPQSPTLRYVFPEKYREKHGKVPFHLKYIRERLCLGQPESFQGVEDMLLAFKQMFTQALFYYKHQRKQKYRTAAVACYEQFLTLIEEYYPHHRELFQNLSLD